MWEDFIGYYGKKVYVQRERYAVKVNSLGIEKCFSITLFTAGSKE